MLTGKCKEDFEKWFYSEDAGEAFNYYHLTHELFNDLPFSTQYGVYVEFGISEYNTYICLFMDDDKTFGFQLSQITSDVRMDYPIKRNYKTYGEAQREAIKYFNERQSDLESNRRIS